MENEKKHELIHIPTTEFVGHFIIDGVKIPCAVLYPETENPIMLKARKKLSKKEYFFIGLLLTVKKFKYT